VVTAGKSQEDIGLLWVKNGPDALAMGCLYYPQKQTSVSAAAMTNPDPDPFAD